MNKVNWGYCTHSWNPLAMRCTRTSEGCDHCWHLTMADRLAKNPKMHAGLRACYAGESAPVLCRWNDPMLRKKPAVIATQFMGDLGHPSIQPVDVALVFDMIRMTKQHTYLVLTKRPGNLIRYLERFKKALLNPQALSNLYLGVTVENQRTADERIPILLQIPAAGHWLSIEPMLGPVDLYPAFCGFEPPSWGCGPDISGVVLGGESGPGARPMHPDWARGVRDQCADSGVPLFVKQLNIDGKVSKNPDEWPEDLRVRQTAWGMPA